MNKLVMNYLVVEGYRDAAERFQEEAGMEGWHHLMTSTIGAHTKIAPVSLDTVDHRIIIAELVKSGKIDEALQQLEKFSPHVSTNSSGNRQRC